MNPPIQLKKILIAVEDSVYSDIATEYAFSLAKQLHADVALVHVNEGTIAPVPYVADPLMIEPPLMMPELIHFQEEASKNLLNKICDTYGDGLNLFTFNKIGDPKTEILAVADEWNADMIVLGTHGRTGFDHFLSGSVAESISRHAKCPVLIIPNNTEVE